MSGLAQDRDPPTDPVVRRAFRAGCRATTDHLVRRERPALLARCRRLTTNPVDGEELAHETLVRVLEARALYEPTRPFRRWLQAIALNLFRDRLRSAWWRRVVPMDPDLFRLLAAAPHAGDTERAVRGAILRLPGPYRATLWLFHLEGRTYDEIARATGDTVPALKQRVHRGNAILRPVLLEMLGEDRKQTGIRPPVGGFMDFPPVGTVRGDT